MQSQKIEFRKERDFTAVLGDAIRFLKQNFKPLFSAILLIIGPIILLSGLFYGYLQTLILNNAASPGLGAFNETYFITLGLTYLLMIINGVLLNSVVFNYIGLYREKEAGEKITVAEVAARVRSSIGRLLAAMLILILLVVVAIAVVALICLGFASMGVFGAIILILLLLCLFLIYGPVLTYYVSAGFLLVVRDHIGILAAFGKVRGYLSGNFWWTWLLMVVALIALSILQFLFNLPAAIVTMSETFTRIKHMSDGSGLGTSETSVLLIVFYTIGRVVGTCSYAILHLICAFNFFSHEERSEGQGIMERIDEIK